MRAKKFLSVLLALVMAVTTMAVLAVSASAESLESTAKSIKSGTQYTATLENYNDEKAFKLKVSKSGTLTLNFTTYIRVAFVYIYNSAGKIVPVSDISVIKGQKSGWSDKSTSLNWSDIAQSGKATFKYAVEKGTYYLKFRRGNFSESGEKNKVVFTAKYPSSDSSSDVKINSFAIPMKVGDTLQLDTVLSANTDDNVTWKSSKTSVAKVSATGKITAKSKGTATITASIGDSTMQIQVKVS